MNCIRCGRCCKNIRGNISEQEKEFIENNFFGQLPIIQLIPVEDMSLSLWPEEAELLKDKAKELDIRADIRPFRAVFNLDKNESIILSYFLDHDSCPFLKNDGCLVYKDRPLVCRQFPIQTISLEKTPVFSECPAVNPLKKEEFKDFFGETYEAAVKNDSLIKQQNNYILSLIKNKTIRPVKGYPYDFLLKRIENNPKKDFSFL